jgi:thiol-disulfide isomerase/thioredoxin
MRLLRLLFALITLAAPFSLAQSTVLQIEPACPVYGAEDYGSKEITLTYNTRNPSAILKTPQKPILDIVVNGPFWANNTRTASFTAQPDGSWHATVKHAKSDYWAYMIFQVRDQATGQIDHNSGHYWDLVFCNKEGGSNVDGVDLQVESYTGTSFDNGMSRVPDFNRALAILDDFMRTAGSERYSLLFDVWDLKVRREDDANLGWKKVAQEIRQFINDHSDDEPALRSAFAFVSNHETRLPPDLYPTLMRNLNRLDPEVADRLDRRTLSNRIRHIPDLRKRADAMAEFMRKYSDDPMVCQLAPEVFEALWQLHDVRAAEALFQQRVQFDPDFADTYAAMGAVYIDNNVKLEEGLRLLDKGEQLGKTISQNDREVHRFLVMTPDPALSAPLLAYWRARSYLLEGKAQLAVPLAQQALDAHKTSRNHFLLAQALEATGDKQKAVDAYLEALRLPDREAPEELQRLQALWVSDGFGTKEELQKKLVAQQDVAFEKTEYVPQLMDRPVSSYEFTTLKGERFRSADLNDKVFVLNVWAAWCGPCIPELPAFQRLQQKHPELVVAALAVDSDTESIQRIITEQKLDSLRIMQADAMSKIFYPGQGVPLTYVIDHGHIRVIHRQSLDNVAAYIEADLAAVKTQSGKSVAASAAH